jgi:peptidoglycan/LPS O-acetylase OafA/YrhL
VRLLPKSRFSWVPFALLLVTILCFAMRAWLGPNASSQRVAMPTHLRFDSLFAGVALSWLYWFKRHHFLHLRSSLLPMFTIVIIGWQFLWNVPPYLMHTVGYTANLIGFALLLAWSINSDLPGKLTPLAIVGRHSYSIYLWHVALAAFFWRMLGSGFLSFWAYLIVAVAVGIIMSKCIEVPSLALRERWFAQQVSRVATYRVRPPSEAVDTVQAERLKNSAAL